MLLNSIQIKNMREIETRNGVAWSCRLFNVSTSQVIATCENTGRGGMSILRATNKENQALLLQMTAEAQKLTGDTSKFEVLENLVGMADNEDFLSDPKVLKNYQHYIL